MLTRAEFDRYLEFFNSRDYDAVLGHYVAVPTISFGGITLRSRAAIRSFYSFFHAAVDERILIDAFLSSEERVVLEARVHLTGLRDVSPASIQAEYPGLVIPPSGKTLVLPQYIHYRVSGNKFESAHCVLSDQPRLLPD
ncbi:MAG: nuclear transport factor 2 family protein [Proteobacteria bacterium]|nr:nuclear transport factor 2 family protein [Pseudomonadota bacterium]